MAQFVQDGAFCVALNCSGAQSVHTRSTTFEGVFDTEVPASQFFQAMQATALAVVLNEPLAHALQVRFVVGVPSAATMVPGGHT